ncbi:MAG: serine/threonine-protein kinase [Blastocatellales bacterium]
MISEDASNMRAFEGETIAGRYKLERFLDEGAFGAVFKASHKSYGVELREVAIKIAKRPLIAKPEDGSEAAPAFDDRKARLTFQDAFRMAKIADGAPDAALRQHFIMVYDAGYCPEGGPLAFHPYVVMELAPGGSLSRMLRMGAFTLTSAINYFDQMLRAVAFMHEQGVIHRDLKPGNIMVVQRPDAPHLIKVGDFGLVIEVNDLMGWVESGGDLAYLAPESFSHNICSPQSDVYMLALVFYQMLAKRNPFDEVGSHLRGTDEDKRRKLRDLHLNARRQEAFPALNDHVELKQRPALRRVIHTALQVDMVARKYRNAGELLAAWEQAKIVGFESAAPPAESPRSKTQRLVREAEQCFAVGDCELGDGLLREAMEINRKQVTDANAVGPCYLLAVKRLMERGETDEAGIVANEGLHRRECASTCRAMARYFDAIRSPLAARFEQQAENCADRE